MLPVSVSAGEPYRLMWRGNGLRYLSLQESRTAKALQNPVDRSMTFTYREEPVGTIELELLVVRST
jgi:hypothetical protein